MILDNIGRSSSTDSTTSQVGAGSRSHDLGDATCMIIMFDHFHWGALKEDSSGVTPRLVFLSTQPSATRQADISRQMLSIFSEKYSEKSFAVLSLP